VSSPRGCTANAVDAAAALLLAVAIDLAFGEPPDAVHPVVWLGKSIDLLENKAPDLNGNRSLAYGAVATLGIASAVALLAHASSSSLRLGPRWMRILGLAVLLKPAFALKALLSAGGQVHDDLQRGDLGAARQSLRNLVSRDTAGLTAEECASAAVESLAENVTDSLVAPWLGFISFGLPGAWAIRAVNTLDSRWGYRGRYEKLGKVPAVTDDLVAWIPARLSSVLLAAGARVLKFDAGGAMRCLKSDRTKTLSPNAGWTMATMAGALGCQLEKAGEYRLNSGARVCTLDDITHAERLVLACSGLFVLTSSLSALALNRGVR
jgi:adenosylcobinamide-phosphate synthase